MGSRSFSAWPKVEEYLDSIPDGRNAWRHRSLPFTSTIREREGQPIVGRAWRSKSLFINEAITHYIRAARGEESCATLVLNIAALQEVITKQGELIEELERRKSLWHRIFG